MRPIGNDQAYSASGRALLALVTLIALLALVSLFARVALLALVALVALITLITRVSFFLVHTFLLCSFVALIGEDGKGHSLNSESIRIRFRVRWSPVLLMSSITSACRR